MSISIFINLIQFNIKINKIDVIYFYYYILNQNLLMDIQLTNKQHQALLSSKSGKNLFLTGPAGSGKSFLLKYFITWFQKEKENKENRIFITSTTGLSSLLIDGMTINRYSGIGIGTKDVDYYFKKIWKMKAIKERWLNTSVLIIDEISMMDPDIFDKLEILARKIRKNEAPFGGIQIILSGDFLQLPPVKSDSFCFESFSWDSVIHETFYFDKIVRQSDSQLQSILNYIRIGIVNEEVTKCLDSCINKELLIKDGITPTLLFSKKNMVIEHNDKEINKLIDNGALYHIYDSIYDFGKITNEETITIYKELLNSQFQVDDKIMLSLHSQVMLTVNIPEYELANGSVGVIVDFKNDEKISYPIVLFLNGITMTIKEHLYKIDEDSDSIKKYQIPLMLSWAITIHKAQGMSLDFVRTDIGSSIFEYGQAYVVLSRIKSIDGLSLINVDYSKIKAHPKILKYYSKLF